MVDAPIISWSFSNYSLLCEKSAGASGDAKGNDRILDYALFFLFKPPLVTREMQRICPRRPLCREYTLYLEVKRYWGNIS